MTRYFVYLALLVPWAFAMGVTFPDRRLFSYTVLGLMALLLAGVMTMRGRVMTWLEDHHATTLERLHGRVAEVVPAGENWREGVAMVGRLFLDALFTFIIVVPAASYVPIGYGLAPGLYRLALLWAIFWLGLQFVFGRRFPHALRLDVPLMVLIPLSLCGPALLKHYIGSRPAACSAIVTSERLRPIITRDQLEASTVVQNTFPYDVKTDGNLIFYSLKQRRSGFVPLPWEQNIANDGIGVLDRRQGFDEELIIPLIGESTATYPQRIAVNPGRQEIYTVVLDLDGDHFIHIAAYTRDLSRFEEVRRLPLEFEPIRPYVEADGNVLLVLGYEGEAARYDTRTWEPLEHYSWGQRGFMGVLDTLVLDASGEAFYASVVSNRFHRLDRETFEVLQSVNVGVPTIGLDYDRQTNLVYAAGTLTREILVLDGDTLDVRERLYTGTTARELFLDDATRELWVLGYIDGELDIFDLETHESTDRVMVGKVARGLHLQEATGRVYVTSSCGVFEVER